jgi:hypothetical protein
MSKHSEVNTARVSVLYWKKQAREALDTHNSQRFQKCCQKLSHWEEILNNKRMQFYNGRPRRVAAFRGPVEHPRHGAPDAPTAKEWVPLPLTWD